ncbi:MAG: tetratricopeptide repeat protein [Verrucomicrobiota bacterium]|jgi:tetratricopeptide (TPR) repeat protein
MKRLVALLILILAARLPQARAQQGPDDQYIIIYSLMQQADSLDSSGQPRQALAQYVQVQGELEKFQKIYPDWSPRIVNFRLKYLAEKIAEVTAKLPVTPQSGMPSPAPPPPGAASSTSAADLEAQFGALHEQVQKLQVDNTTLQAKLQEALAAQPATIDSRELTQARAKIRSLMKENDLLKVSLSQGKAGTAMGPAVAESDALKLAELALAEANQKLAGQTARANKLALENQALQSRVQALLASPETIQALREENALLKKQIADFKPAAPDPAEAARLNSELTGMRKQIAALQAASAVSFLEKSALENRVRQLQIAAVNSAPVAPPPNQAENEARIRALTQERNDLLAKLGEANQELYGRRKQDAAARINVLTDEVNALRARLAVDEAQVIPYTPEELALFKPSAPQLANRNAEKKSIKELPGGAAQLVAEAQNYFSARQYDKAEDDYQKILQHDENNGLVLANLATIEMEQGRLDDAEKHIKAAVAQSPDDPYNLSTLGRLEFLREKYDEALDALSRAAKLDPRNPEIQNYLGVTLSHKGLRTQAETALRKAIQLDPNYGPAHNNLAVIYISQLPPLVELARWHYQKALDAGQPHNPDLEKMLDAKGAPANPQ